MSTTDSSKKQSFATFFGMVAFAVLLVGALRLAQYISDKRHPAVSEHRAELVEAAAKRLDCEPDALAIVVEGPTRARVERDSKAATFIWMHRRGEGVPAYWHEIDPTCRADVLGCSIPCY